VEVRNEVVNEMVNEMVDRGSMPLRCGINSIGTTLFR
jgi:hypothetical protein